MNNFNFSTRLLLNCAGVDITTISQCTPSEVRKYTIMGGCVLIPSILGLFSGGYTMFLITESLWSAVCFAPAWSWVIFTLDRAVVSNTRPGRISFGVIGRMFLAVIIAFSISEPLTLRIFKDAIEDKRVELLSQKEDAATAKIDQQINDINSISQQEKTKVEQLNTSYIQEVDGTGGSKVPYRGPIAEIKWQAYQKGLNDFNVNEMKRQSQLTSLQRDRQNKVNQVEKVDAKGFLGNLRILGRLMDEDSHVWWCVWLVRLLFLCIELIPVFIKLGSPSDKDLYNKMKDMNDNDCLMLQTELCGEKREASKLEQILLIQEKKNNIQYQLTKGIMNAKGKQYELFLDEIKYAMEQKLKAQDEIIERVSDSELRNQMLKQINEAYNNYTKTLESLMSNDANGEYSKAA